MHSFTILFLALLAAGCVLEWWLQARQARHVRALRERVPGPFAGAITDAEHARAADYTIALVRWSACAIALHAAVVVWLTVGGGLALIDVTTAALRLAGDWHGVAVVAATGLLVTLAGVPLDLWRTFGIEARFGFNRTTAALYVADQLKGLAIAAVLFLPLVALLLWLMRRAGAGWWLWALGAWAVFSLALAWAWPRLIAPLFNRFHELEAGALRDSVEALARRCGFTVRGVRVMDGSRRSAHGNAYFTGFGNAKRIVFFDTLLATLAPGEVQAVLAHELGHYRLRHVALRLALSLAAAAAGFALLGRLADADWFQPALGVTAGGPHTLLVLFALAAPVFLKPLGPLGAWLSRRHEFAADAYAARHAEASALRSALVKLYRDNATTLTPDPVYTAFHASHPPALERIARLGGTGNG